MHAIVAGERGAHEREGLICLPAKDPQSRLEGMSAHGGEGTP
jgi:hypothetical protein